MKTSFMCAKPTQGLSHSNQTPKQWTVQATNWSQGPLSRSQPHMTSNDVAQHLQTNPVVINF